MISKDRQFKVKYRSFLIVATEFRNQVENLDETSLNPGSIIK